MTSETLHPVPVLPLEEVHDQAIVAHAVYLPLLLARDLRRQVLELGLALRSLRDLGLLQYSVQVLVQAIKQEAQELLRVVLFRAGELGRVAADRSLRTTISMLSLRAQVKEREPTRKVTGERVPPSPCHKSRRMPANACARFPFVPIGFTIFTALFHRPSVKKRENGTVALRHWMVEFM